MKTIKFRFWDRFKKEMIYKDIHGIVLGYLGINLNEEYLMQFTGLLDKNGKEIYEGDVVKTGIETIGEIVFHEERASFILHDKQNFNESLFHRMPFAEVIGNIYETPELLS